MAAVKESSKTEKLATKKLDKLMNTILSEYDRRGKDISIHKGDGNVYTVEIALQKGDYISHTEPAALLKAYNYMTDAKLTGGPLKSIANFDYRDLSAGMVLDGQENALMHMQSMQQISLQMDFGDRDAKAILAGLDKAVQLAKTDEVRFDASVRGYIKHVTRQDEVKANRARSSEQER